MLTVCECVDVLINIIKNVVGDHSRWLHNHTEPSWIERRERVRVARPLRLRPQVPRSHRLDRRPPPKESPLERWSSSLGAVSMAV